MKRNLILSMAWSVFLYCVCIAWFTCNTVGAVRAGRMWAAFVHGLLGLGFVLVAIIEILRFPDGEVK